MHARDRNRRIPIGRLDRILPGTVHGHNNHHHRALVLLRSGVHATDPDLVGDATDIQLATGEILPGQNPEMLILFDRFGLGPARPGPLDSFFVRRLGCFMLQEHLPPGLWRGLFGDALV